MAGTLNITNPAVDNEPGHDSSFLRIDWTFAGTGTSQQVQRRVTVRRADSSTLTSDTGLQSSTATTYTVSNLNSGIYYVVTVSVLDTNGDTTSASRTIVARYARSLPPVVSVAPTSNGLAVTVTNPSSGDRPPVTGNKLYRRTSGGDGTWELVAAVAPGVTYVDRDVRSGATYDYFARGESNPGAAAVSGTVTGDGTLSAQVQPVALVDSAIVDTNTVGA